MVLFSFYSWYVRYDHYILQRCVLAARLWARRVPIFEAILIIPGVFLHDGEAVHGLCAAEVLSFSWGHDIGWESGVCVCKRVGVCVYVVCAYVLYVDALACVLFGRVLRDWRTYVHAYRY